MARSSYNLPSDLGCFVVRRHNEQRPQTSLVKIFKYKDVTRCLMCAAHSSLLITPVWFAISEAERGAIVCVICNACACSTGANLRTTDNMKQFMPEFSLI